MTEEHTPPSRRPRTWGMTLGLVIAVGCSAYCLYGVWNGLAFFAGMPWIVRIPVGLLLGALTFVGASVATVWCAAWFDRRR